LRWQVEAGRVAPESEKPQKSGSYHREWDPQ